MRSSYLLASLGLLASCIDDGPDPDIRTAMVDTPLGRAELTFEVIDGLAIYQGDIVLGRADELDRTPYAATREYTSFRWPNGYIPYSIGSGFSTTQRQSILDAVAHWNANTPLRIYPRTTESDYVQFVTGTGCSSQVGRIGDAQAITLASTCTTGNIIHELGHAAGLWHEQSRADRDSYITVLWDNILAGEQNRSQFETYTEQGLDGLSPFSFDFGSVMLYSSYNSFGKPGLPTMTKKDGSAFVGQRNGLSDLDIAGAVNFLTYTQGTTTVFNITNVNSGKCLALQAPGVTRNLQLTQQTCDYFELSQRWYLWQVPGTGAQALINAKSGQCVDVPNNSTASGVWLQQFPCHARANQQLAYANITINPSTYVIAAELVMQNSGLCLDVANASTAPGAHVNQFGCHNGANQRWEFHRVITD